MNEKDHLIPACVIGQFTKGKEGNNWREQKVYKFDIRRGKKNLVQSKNIGWIRGGSIGQILALTCTVTNLGLIQMIIRGIF